MLTVGSLFAGIGGFDLGLERAGMRTVWFCEQDEYCRRVLARHWPGVPCHPDVRALVADASQPRRETRDGDSLRNVARPRQRPIAREDREGPVPVPVPYVDVLCGGFPCQDLSYAGRGAGIDGARSGLWAEYARLVRELRPRYVIVENVPALLARGLGRVLGDLAACGYDAEWDCIPAAAVGAPHRRDRVWIVAYPNANGGGREVGGEQDGRAERPGREASQRHDADGFHADVAYPARDLPAGATASRAIRERARQGSQPSAMAYPHGAGLEGHRGPDGRPGELAAATRSGPDRTGVGGENGGWWLIEPSMGRVAHGIPRRVDRLRSLGNALVPQIAEWIGRRIIEHEQVSP